MKVINKIAFFLVAFGCFYFSLEPLLAEEDYILEKKASDVIKKFAQNYQNKRFGYISDGHFFHLPREAAFGIWVTDNTKQTIQSGRVLAITFVNEYFTELQNNKTVSNWYQALCVFNPTFYSGTFGLKNIGVRIAFWDENVDRPKAPYLAEIDFYDNKFRYYEADPKTQALKLVLEESYEDAVKHLAQS